jgi:orotidine-5'-phosphate decarboxylase
MRLTDKIIVALDVGTLEEAIALVDKLPEVKFWKVGLELFLHNGKEVLQFLQQHHKRIFLDLKFHDIPNTMAGACRQAAQYGVDLCTVHAAAGKIALATSQQEAIAAAQLLGIAPPRLIAITLLTSLTPQDLAFDLKIPLELPQYALDMALLAQNAGLSGAVCSPQEVEHLRKVCGQDFILVCPGIRPSWAEAIDQQRSMTPKAAFQAGADYLVIGRPITAAPEPEVAWQRICEELL